MPNLDDSNGGLSHLHKTLLFFSEMQFLFIIDAKKKKKADLISTPESEVSSVGEDFQWILNTEKTTWLYPLIGIIIIIIFPFFEDLFKNAYVIKHKMSSHVLLDH